MTTHTNSNEPPAAGDERIHWLPFQGGFMLDCAKSSRLWKVVHSNFTFCILHRGGAQWTYRQRSFPVAPEAVYVCEPGEVHATTSVCCPGDFTAFFLDVSALNELVSEFGVRSAHFRWDGVPSRELWRLFTRARNVLAAGNTEAFGQSFSAALSRLVRDSEPRAQLPMLSSDRVLQARSLLEEQFLADPSSVVRLEPIAKEIGVSYHSLVHSFSKRYRLAPYQFVSALRAQYALKLLLAGPTETCESLTALAQISGYSDNAHLTRSFRHHWGNTPSRVAHQLHPAWLRRKQESVGGARKPKRPVSSVRLSARA